MTDTHQLDHGKPDYPLTLTVVTVLGLSALNWLYVPERAIYWAGVAAITLMASIFIPLIGSRTIGPEGTLNLRRGLFGAGLIFSGALAVSLVTEMGILNDPESRRAGGVLMGLVLIVSGNLLPKAVRPMVSPDMSASCARKTERRAGAIMVAGGFFYTATWIFAPVEMTRPLTLAIGAIMITGLVFLMTKPGTRQN